MDRFHGALANKKMFLADEGFPTIGFKKAKFTLFLQYGKASEFNWKSDASWVSVNNDGEVEFISEGNKDKVTITATPKTGGDPLKYSFSLNKWFHSSDGASIFTWEEANNPSSPEVGLPAYRLPTIEEVVKVDPAGKKGLYYEPGVLGSLINEWGDISHYKEPNRMPIVSFWTSEKHEHKNYAYHYVVHTDNGAVVAYPDSLHSEAFWIKNL